jgi:MFS family permease
MNESGPAADARGIDSGRAWLRLATAVVISTIGNVGLWSYVVALPVVQAEFGATRAQASLPYTLTMIGFAVGALMMGRISDKFGIMVPLAISSVALGLGYVACARAPNLWLFTASQAVLIGFFGASTLFAPLMADISHWFARRRGAAVAIAAAGNYISGAIWPPILQHFIAQDGWRTTHAGVGLFCVATMLPLSFVFRRRLGAHGHAPAAGGGEISRPLGLSPATLQLLLCIAGIGCCVAMAMPQVHLVAYCTDLGYGPAAGADMLALMLGFGIVSRVGSGFLADRIGGLATLLLGSLAQGAALVLYFIFSGLTPLYVISALFGLFQGGIVPSYAIIVREYFPAREAGTRVSLTIMMTVFGMGLGGWMSGAIFDLTNSYRAAFANGIAWNVMNAAIALWLLSRGLRWRRASSLAAA